MQRAGSTNMKGSVIHKHGTPNPIIFQEEEAMIAIVNRSVASSSNAQIIGRNGEIPLRDFLNRYLPYVLRANTGHFASPSGKLSPQVDIMILDARYPLLSQNADGSVLAMLHSLVATIEVKTRIATKDILPMWENAKKVVSLAKEVKNYSNRSWSSVETLGFSFGCVNRLDTLEIKYEKEGDPKRASLDISILRVHTKDAIKDNPLGVEFHFEPHFASTKSSKVLRYDMTSIPQYTPLSDFYYHLVQNSYYTLGSRDYDLNDIGAHITKYMSWSTLSWDNYYQMKKKESS